MDYWTSRYPKQIFYFSSTTLRFVSYLSLWVSLFFLLPLHPIPVRQKEQSQLLRDWMHSWQLQSIAFMHIDQKKLLAIATKCMVKPVQNFFQFHSPSRPSNLDRRLNVGSQWCWQIPHCQYTNRKIRPHVPSSAKLRWKFIFHLSTGVSLRYHPSGSQNILPPTSALSVTAIFWNLIVPSVYWFRLELIQDFFTLVFCFVSSVRKDYMNLLSP